MKINYLGKSRLSVVIVLSAASVAFSQTEKDSTRSKDIEQVVLTGVADIAKDRKTPVAVSTIKEAQIVEKLGNQEFPEILNTTPSVYATKGGGGFGDGRINIRGFANENIAVMINGVPINDMENGAVFWSNWAGLSDVTSAMQVQRGLGSSKLAIASVGGTINIVTRSADKKREGNVSVGVANDGYLKTLFSYNTGLTNSGWSTSFLMSRTAGSMYFDGSEFEGYNYYFALGYKPNSTHDFQFTFTGAPQWHHQNFANPISSYIQNGGTNGGDPNRKYNSSWGHLNGEEFSTARNFYSKPIMSLNWDWKMTEKSKLSTVVYASWGRGGGTGVLGSLNTRGLFNSYNYTTFAQNQGLARTSNGLIRFDDIVKWNQGGIVQSFNPTTPNANEPVNTFPAGQGINRSNNGITLRANINSHDWYGVLSNFQHKINSNLNFSVGIDGRYYYGYHPGVVTNFLGALGYQERGDLNRPTGYIVNLNQQPTPSANPFAAAVKDKSQIANRNYDGEVRWLGSFGQLEYNNGPVSAFFQGSVSNQGFQRIDNWIIDGVTKQNGQIVNRKTGFENLWGYNVKGGTNYNIDSYNNVFANIGYYSKQPFLNSVYPSNRQVLNPNLTNEKIFSAELGYGIRVGGLRANLNFYRTAWKDRWQRRNTTGTNFAEFSGIQQVHYGAEFDASYKMNDYLSLDAMFSYGDYRYKGNATGQEFDENYVPLTTTAQQLKLDGARVGDAAQTTASLGLNIEPTKGLRITPQWRYADRLYSQIDVNTFVATNDVYANPVARLGTLKLPSYNVFDLGASYKFKLGNTNSLTITGNVYNLFDTIYISEGRTSVHNNLQRTDFATGTTGDQNYARYVQIGDWNGVHQSNQVYFGFGRTWAASISYKF